MTTAPPSTGAPAPAAASTGVPALADGVVLIGGIVGSGYRTPPSLVRRSDGQTIQLTPLLYRVLAEIDGHRDHAQIAERVTAATDRAVTAEDVATLVRAQLLPLGLLRLADGRQPEVKRAQPLLGLRFRYVVTDPEVTRRLTAPFARLFHPLLAAALVSAFVAVCAWMLVEKGLGSATHQALYEPGLLLTVFAVTVLSAGFHEFGHAAAARYGGATPGAMGTGLYLVWPAFYTDVTDSYRLGRAGRVRTDLGGLYFNAIAAVAMFCLWWAVRWDAVLLVIAAQVLQMVRQLAPLVRFDGYHVLADVTGVPDLYQHIRPTLLGLLPHHWGRREDQVLKPWARAVVSVWVLVVVPVLLGTLVLMVVAFPRVAATAWDSVGRQASRFGTAFAEGDVVDMAARLLSVVAIALPVLAMAYIVSRVVGQASTATWRATGDRPGRRAVAVLAALAVVAGLAWAWWPSEDRYRPIQSWERGSLVDVLPASARDGLASGTVGRASTSWPASDPLPTADEPVLAVVLVPRDGAAGDATTTTVADTTGDTAAAPGTWVFPFDRPPAPVEGDNQALAVNTTDGSTVYDVAFALVWAEDGTADNVNSAYALASCRECTTVAVAFQVVLVVGRADVVPQNLAAAVNYSCIACVTAALAQQLVVTVDGPLGEDTAGALAGLWADIAEFGESLEGLSLTEIRDRLSLFEREILAVLDAEAGGSTRTATPGASPATTPSTGSATATPSDGPNGSPTPSPAASTTVADEGGPTEDATTSPSSSTDSDTSPTEPSPSPTDGTSTETTTSPTPTASP